MFFVHGCFWCWCVVLNVFHSEVRFGSEGVFEIVVDVVFGYVVLDDLVVVLA